MIGIINYNAGNIKSVKNSLDYLNIKNKLINKREDFKNVGGIILPGVGAFGRAVENLKRKKLFTPLKNYIENNNKFLGICLGMQLLFEKSNEAPFSKGFSIFKGKSFKFKKGSVPNIGWRSVSPVARNQPSILKEDYYYFLHSYYIINKNKKIITGLSKYHITFTAAVNYKNIWGVQFHPEKSSESGLKFLKDWSNL